MSSNTPKLKASEHALREISLRLASGDLPEGSHLPPERELAAELGVSRRALREALGRLEAEGRVWRGVGRGTIVGTTPNDYSASDKTSVKTLTSPSVLMEARLALEPEVAALAVMHATTEDLEEMHRCLKKSAGVTEHEGWDRWDGALHRAISHAAHNPMISALYELLSSARAHTQWGQLRKASLTRQRQRLYTQQHEAILTAINDRNADEATRCMRAHLLTVRQTMLNPWEYELNSDPQIEHEPPEVQP